MTQTKCREKQDLSGVEWGPPEALAADEAERAGGGHRPWAQVLNGHSLISRMTEQA